MNNLVKKMCVGMSLSMGLVGVANATYVEGNPLSYVDPLGLEKVILFPKNTAEWAAANGVPDTPGVCVVYAHGKPGFVSPTTNAKDAINADGLKNIIDSHSECKPKMPVQLMSCDGGTGGNNSIAKNLADKLNRTVSGYDGYVGYTAPLWPFSASVAPLPTVTNQTFSPKK